MERTKGRVSVTDNSDDPEPQRGYTLGLLDCSPQPARSLMPMWPVVGELIDGHRKVLVLCQVHSAGQVSQQWSRLVQSYAKSVGREFSSNRPSLNPGWPVAVDLFQLLPAVDCMPGRAGAPGA